MNAFAAIDQINDRIQIQSDLDADRIELLNAVAQEQFKEAKEIKETGFDMCDLTDKFGECPEFEELVFVAANTDDFEKCIPALRALHREVRKELLSASLLAAEAQVEREHRNGL